MTDYVVYGAHASPFVRKVEAVLHHAGVEYDFENVSIMKMPDWFVEISPARRIPALRYKPLGAEGIAGTIADSSAIVLFLDKHLGLDLYGADAFEAGRVAWFEEYADTNFAMTLGMEVFRPIVFPAFGGNPPDLETARKAWSEKLPPIFDYLEASLDGGEYFVGNAISMADFAVAAQMSQITLVTHLPDAATYPALVKHTEKMVALPGFAQNLEKASAMIGMVVKEKVDLN